MNGQTKTIKLTRSCTTTEWLKEKAIHMLTPSGMGEWLLPSSDFWTAVELVENLIAGGKLQRKKLMEEWSKERAAAKRGLKKSELTLALEWLRQRGVITSKSENTPVSRVHLWIKGQRKVADTRNSLDSRQQSEITTQPEVCQFQLESEVTWRRRNGYGQACDAMEGMSLDQEADFLGIPMGVEVGRA